MFYVRIWEYAVCVCMLQKPDIFLHKCYGETTATWPMGNSSFHVITEAKFSLASTWNSDHPRNNKCGKVMPSVIQVTETHKPGVSSDRIS